MSDEYFDSSYSKICRLELDILGNIEASRMSVLDKEGITLAETNTNSQPQKGGINDARLGSASNTDMCPTCGLNTTFCNGHFGHIKLAHKLFNAGYFSFILKILSCICIKCCNLLVVKNEDELRKILKHKSGKERMAYFKMSGKNITYCQNCGVQISKIKEKTSIGSRQIISETELDTKIEGEQKKKLRQFLTATMIYHIFNNISDDTCRMLGINPERSRPEYMIYDIFLVPPIQVRPPVKGDIGGGQSEDDLTRKIGDIIKANERMKKEKEKKTEATEGLVNLTQLHVAQYIDNNFVPMKSDIKGRITKDLTQRLSGKTGRFRGNLMGKRVNFTGRTVITSDPCISIEELGIPIMIAMNLTTREYVTPHNIEKMTKLLRNGKYNYPGANFLYQYSRYSLGSKVYPIDLSNERRKDIVLNVGDMLDRHLQNNDMVLFNRQPSLHKQSAMGHIAKIINNPDLMTFRLSPAVTPPYNADFDGDEMNTFCPQSVQSDEELRSIACVKNNLIAAAFSFAVYGIVQDGLLGSLIFTSPDTIISYRNTMNLLSNTSFEDFKLITKDKSYTGCEIISMLLPDNINVSNNLITIKNSKLISGRLTKKMLGAKQRNNLVQIIWDTHGVDETMKFINNIQRTINNFNLIHGFSVGIKDLVMPKSVHKDIDILFETSRTNVEYTITEMENNPNDLHENLYELKIFSELNVIRENVSKLIMANYDPNNAINIMALSGSKGDETNTAQMIGCVGMQAFEGALMPKKYNGRTSPYHYQHDDRPESRGLVRQSFIDGLSFSEYIFHTMSSRLGTIDQVVKTAVTGYAQRKLIKMMEDNMIAYDSSVRNANGKLMQIIYGDSGADTTKQYEYIIKMLEYNNDEIRNKYQFTTQELKKYSDFSEKENDKMIETIFSLRDIVRINAGKAKINHVSIVNKFMIPVNLNRIISTQTNKKEKTKDDELIPSYILEKINFIIDNKNTIILCMSEKERLNKSSFKARDSDAHKLVFKTCLYDILSPKRVLIEYGLTKNQFDKIVNEIIDNFNKNMIEAGQMVGVIAGQSTVEPLTQMQLNSFHHAGIAKISGTQGVPRMQELLSVSKKPKTPQMVIYLTDDIRGDKMMANKIASHLKHTLFGEIRNDIQLFYDSDIKNSKLMENDNVKHVFFHQKGSKISCQSDITGLPWVFRIELNREKMLEKEVTMLEIKSKFCNWWETRFADPKTMKKDEKKVLNKIVQIAVLSNTDNDVIPILHIRFNVKDVDKEKDRFDLNTVHNFIDNIIDKFKLKGIDGIINIDDVSEEKIMVYNNETGGVDKVQHNVLYVGGTNLTDIRYFVGIDLIKTISNNITHVYETFGIEIARSVLLIEIIKAYELAGTMNLNYQHVVMIVDQMTCSGVIVSLDRHGMSKSDSEPLSRASFEKTVEQLFTSAVYGETDYMNSVSSRIMAGQVIRGGTGFCDVELDIDMIENSEYIDEYDISKTTELNKDNIANDIIKNKKNSQIFMPF